MIKQKLIEHKLILLTAIVSSVGAWTALKYTSDKIIIQVVTIALVAIELYQTRNGPRQLSQEKMKAGITIGLLTAVCAVAVAWAFQVSLEKHVVLHAIAGLSLAGVYETYQKLKENQPT